MISSKVPPHGLRSTSIKDKRLRLLTRPNICGLGASVSHIPFAREGNNRFFASTCVSSNDHTPIDQTISDQASGAYKQLALIYEPAILGQRSASRRQVTGTHGEGQPRHT
jgi:hypothetical protein